MISFEFSKSFRKPVLQNNSRWLLLLNCISNYFQKCSVQEYFILKTTIPKCTLLVFPKYLFISALFFFIHNLYYTCHKQTNKLIPIAFNVFFNYSFYKLPKHEQFFYKISMPIFLCIRLRKFKIWIPTKMLNENHKQLSSYKTVWQTVITSCYKNLISSWTTWTTTTETINIVPNKTWRTWLAKSMVNLILEGAPLQNGYVTQFAFSKE